MADGLSLRTVDTVNNQVPYKVQESNHSDAYHDVEHRFIADGE